MIFLIYDPPEIIKGTKVKMQLGRAANIISLLDIKRSKLCAARVALCSSFGASFLIIVSSLSCFSSFAICKKHNVASVAHRNVHDLNSKCNRKN